MLSTALRYGVCHVSLQRDSVKTRRGFVEGQFFKREMTRSKSIMKQTNKKKEHLYKVFFLVFFHFVYDKLREISLADKLVLHSWTVEVLVEQK